MEILSSTLTRDSIRVSLNNGSEFSIHFNLDGKLRITTQFCDVIETRKTAANVVEIFYSKESESG